jgi:NADH-quinone oxidoreductase subunit L
MPLAAWLLLIATAAPLVSFGALCAVGRQLGRPWAGLAATSVIAVSFACSIVAMLAWLGGGSTGAVPWGAGQMPIVQTAHWVDPAVAGEDSGAAGSAAVGAEGRLSVGIYIDSLTVILAATITLVALLVHFFSLGYMRRDPQGWRYFAYLGLFCASMLGLVLGGTLISIFICWELVGLCSYLLIGFWNQRPRARAAAIKAFIVNRVGDSCLLVGIGILMAHVGDLSLPTLWARLGPIAFTGTAGPGAAITPGLLTAVGVLMLLGAIGKSAQFPLHVWLPDAMEGPSPVSALIHAATMVAAGVYLAARLLPILTPDARLFLAIIGAVTVGVGALPALAQGDVKRVLAYSTISQLGLMMLALGVGSWTGGLFHLVTHAFFKSLLFLAAGSVILATGHDHRLEHYGGLIRKMPITAMTFLAGAMAMAGVPIFSGFASKERILIDAGAFAELATHRHGGSAIWWMLFVAPAAAAWVTAFYMGRVWALTFLGRPRNLRVYARAGESPVLWLPLLVLTVLTVVAGYPALPIRGMIESARGEVQAICRAQNAPVTGLDATWVGEAPVEAVEGGETPAPTALVDGETAAALRTGSALAVRWTSWAWLGLAPALLLYFSGTWLAAKLLRFPPLAWVAAWLRNGMYFDDLYRSLLVIPVLALADGAAVLDRRWLDGVVRGIARSVRGLASVMALVDVYVVDAVVLGVAGATGRVGMAARATQSGRVRWYLGALMAALALGAATAAAVLVWR